MRGVCSMMRKASAFICGLCLGLATAMLLSGWRSERRVSVREQQPAVVAPLPAADEPPAPPLIYRRPDGTAVDLEQAPAILMLPEENEPPCSPARALRFVNRKRRAQGLAPIE